jgi:hypothetical protein
VIKKWNEENTKKDKRENNPFAAITH